MIVRGEVELSSQETLDDIQSIMDLPRKISAIEKRIQKLDEDIIILKEFVRCLGAELRKDGRFP